MPTRLISLLFVALFPALVQAAIPERIEGMDLVTKTSISLKKESAEKTVVFFISPACPCSKAHEPTMKALHAEFGTRFRFIALHANQNETVEAAQTHYQEVKLPFPVLRDEKAIWANALGALKTPHVFVYEGNQMLYQGGIDDSVHPENAKKHFLKDALSAIAQGKKPAVEKARALGCVIERE